MRHLFLIIIFALAITPAHADEAEILRRLDAIEKRLSTIESANPMQSLLLKGLENAQKKRAEADQKTDLSVEPPPFGVKILAINSGGKDILGQPIVDLKVSVTNEGTKDIDIVNAFVVIKDRADNTLIRVKWSKNKGIDAGKSVAMAGSYTAGLSDEGIETLLDIDRSLVSAHFDVYKIAFAGGEVTEFKDCLMCDF